MFGWLGRGTQLKRTGHDLYERIVAQARSPEIYTACGVPDTMDGRLEVILLHVVLTLDRLKREGKPGQRLGQRLMETLVADLDDAFRQIGLGDDSIAARMPKLAGALRERAADYGMAVQPCAGAMMHDMAPAIPGLVADALETALMSHIYRPVDAMAATIAIPKVMRLANYVRRCRTTLAAADSRELLEGRIAFPASFG